MVAKVPVPAGDGRTPVTVTGGITLPGVAGVHPIYLRFDGAEGEHLFDVDSFIFR
jgi:hypothetical protein